MMTTLKGVTTIYTLVTTDSYGNIVDMELFSSRPTFPLTRFHALYIGDIDGGDTIRIFPTAIAG